MIFFLLKYNLHSVTSFLVCGFRIFEKCLESCNYHHNQDIEQLPQIPSYPLVVHSLIPYPTLMTTSITFSKISYNWNYTGCSLLSLAYFTQHSAVKSHPHVSSCSFLLLSSILLFLFIILNFS